MEAINTNGFIADYWYDASGERVVKTSGDDEDISVNDVFRGGRTETANFTAYVNPYLVVSKGGRYTKHIYIGSQRIVSKLGDMDSYGLDPRRMEYAGSNVNGAKVDYKTKYNQSQQTIKDRYKAFEVPYYGKDNDDYVNGGDFCCDNKSMTKSFDPVKNDNPELYQYYYHSDHLGSSSLITNLDGEVVQHIEYVPFGKAKGGLMPLKKIGASQFSKIFKGTYISSMTPTNRGKINRIINLGIEKVNEQVRTGEVVNTTIGVGSALNEDKSK